MKNFFTKRNYLIIGLLIMALLSIFVFSKIASSAEFHAKTIKALDDKKITVMELTAATVTTSTLIAAIPSDATSPLASQIVELSEYLLIIVGIIFLEKILLTLTGYVTFSFLIPIACVLFAVYLFSKKEILKVMATKLLLFGIVIFMVVPISVKISDIIENTYNETIEQTIEDSKNIEKTTEEGAANESEGFFDGLVNKTKDVITDIGNNVAWIKEKGEELLSNFIDAIAVLLITTCVIPIIVLLFMVWFIKLIFGINIPIKNIKVPVIKKEEKEKEKVS